MLEFATIIACGGDTKRLGADKRQQALGGETLLDRAIARTASFGGPVALAVRDRMQAPETDMPVPVDPQKNLGPIGAADGVGHARGRSLHRYRHTADLIATQARIRAE